MDLIQRQHDLVRLLGVTANGKVEFNDSAFLDALIEMVAEIGECIDLIQRQNKPWKPSLAPEELNGELKKEMVDILFYTLECLLFLGFASWKDVETAYMEKYQTNLDRIIASSSDTKADQAQGIADQMIHLTGPDEAHRLMFSSRVVDPVIGAFLLKALLANRTLSTDPTTSNGS